MSDTNQPRGLPATIEELEAIIDARIKFDRQKQNAMQMRQDKMHAQHAEIENDARRRRIEATMACNDDLRAIHEKTEPFHLSPFSLYRSGTGR